MAYRLLRSALCVAIGLLSAGAVAAAGEPCEPAWNSTIGVPGVSGTDTPASVARPGCGR